jgi:hypothetical protein
MSKVTRKTVKTKKSWQWKTDLCGQAREQGHRGRKENGIAIKTDKGNWNKDL